MSKKRHISAIKDADAVLSILCSTNASYGIGLIQAEFKIRHNDELPGGYVYQILEKLTQDGYAKRDTDYDSPCFISTFEGLLFLEQRGYKGQLDRETSEADRLTAIEQHQTTLSLASYRVNRKIMRGTIAAASLTTFYLIWLVFSYGIDHNWWFACLKGVNKTP
ncbi:MAG: hypothetical protein JWO03_1501 [Bacteroidetes bacterium]|nr:hypothetical protein [Bacteroidota bacterium]